jgi:hypothetical protein
VYPIDANLAVGSNPKERRQGGTTRSHNELSDASLLVLAPVGVQGSEALIVVVVTAKDHVYSMGVKNSKERILAWVAAVPARTESGMVEERQRT